MPKIILSKKISREIAIRNIKKAHGSLENNSNAKMTIKKVNAMRFLYNQHPYLSFTELGKSFGVGRETARKIIKLKAWV